MSTDTDTATVIEQLSLRWSAAPDENVLEDAEAVGQHCMLRCPVGLGR